MKLLSRGSFPVLALFAAFALAACGGSKKQATESLDTRFRAPQPYSLQTLEHQNYGCGKENEQCAISYLRKVTRQYGPQASLGVLGSLERTSKIDSSFDTHQLAHLVGEATAKQFGANKRAFSLCPNSFNYGCVHGFFIYVLGRSPTPRKAAGLICNSSKEGPLVPTFNCWHGVGHGVMMARGNDLQASLAICDTLGSASAADGCWQGVFMENVNAVIRHEARPGVFSRAHPLRPCTGVLASYRQECYINQAGWLAYLAGNDIGKAARYCLEAPGRYESVCAQSIGLMVTNPSWQVSFLGRPKGQSFAEISWHLCARFPARLRRDCVIGGVDNLANFDQLDVARSKAFCGLVDAKLQRVCYTEIGVNLARRTTDVADARRRCRALPGRHGNECVAGVKQGRLPAAPVLVPGRTTQERVQQPVGKPSATVHMTSAGFSPRVLTIRKGQTVRFLNDGPDDYWPASHPHPIHTDYPGFDALNVVHPGASWSFRFDRVGRWGYHNHLSPETKGVIVVTSAS
jgi:plastocyanin